MNLGEEKQMIVDTAAAFTRDHLKPNAKRWDRSGALDRQTLQNLGELGFGAIYARENNGGSGLSRFHAVLIFEQLSRGCVSHAAFLSIYNMATWMVDQFAGDAVQEKFVPKMAAGEKLASYCLTEPNAGSDAASLRTSAVRDGQDYVLNGSKVFISGAGFSDLYLVMARTSNDGARGISAFIVEASASGLSFGKQESKMGWRAQPTATVLFDDCRVPSMNRIGDEGDGFKIAMSGLDGGRLNIAACSLGGAQEALERAVAYSRDRVQFGRPISDFQALQFKLADMETELQAARALLYAAANKLDEGDALASKFCAMAKRFVTDVGSMVANHALQIHGGYGYLEEYEIERIVRDLRVHQILEGTNEIMRLIIARHLIAERP